MFENYPDVVTTADVQKMLRIGRKSVYTLIKEGALDARYIGRKYIITKASVISFIQP